MSVRPIDKAMTVIFILIAVGVLLYGFPYDNIWTLFTGTCLWLLAVANAKINELIYKKD